MKKKTIYYERADCLAPCKFLGWAKTPLHEVTGLFNAVVQLTRDSISPTFGNCYKGDVLHIPPTALVVKAGRKNYEPVLCYAELPPVDENNLISSRV